jgi:hypothetical protein
MTRSLIVRDRANDFDFAGLMRDAFRPWKNAYDSWNSGVSDLLDRGSAKGECCSKCKSDDCHCRCCVVDSDLLVEARVGERRIVPITIENHWRRERDIEIELSSWTKIDGQIAVEAQIATPAKFTIKPCGEERAILVIEISGSAVDERRHLADVRNCAVAYADLRLKGCDMRSIRIAVAVLPRECDDYVVHCACGCC